ncbi:MAG: hypothetical protein KUA35_04780 [Pseudodesulfovibrio sp.]|uniref:hypothetical protein n=1 Tax=Pseudodesulfovibrio TaxID=2035811 RepID=UPI0012FF349B|nr:MULTISPECIES: hypothetical protein [Pseudodesulfovibrio]MBU4191787.1 hypothetical protein [Pseudomonadota bacterium]MBU4243009.1 hypothetical protein [Pseudomonadota bacterium]MBU4380296.1 hypothetical protein [Pseudomonadota bacterium]MBU4474836.1 hypothetical protein [Pseudomonadota bacterium]MBU4516424.1 hypothetical protein [Pseudomonadota bacterium]
MVFMRVSPKKVIACSLCFCHTGLERIREPGGTFGGLEFAMRCRKGVIFFEQISQDTDLMVMVYKIICNAGRSPLLLGSPE